MKEYQVIARKYRPQHFKDVLGQELIVSTLINAIRHKRIAHAYLFCGTRGTGKTTIARIFAKAINCPHLNADCEPCNECASCKEVVSGMSLDVIEIDGASNRGIDDIRQINETVGYSPSVGQYKIYLIDEVHMLTKEAFNALLKTLEEPPPTVKFLFATTEPHKVPQTILSRCQRFQLNRIPAKKIANKLGAIANDLSLSASKEALELIAHAAEGSLRDAESLFDQIISFQGSAITLDTVTDCLGLMPKQSFFALDNAFASGNLAMAFELSHQVFSNGKDIPYFVESLISHYRSILLIKLNKGSEEIAAFSEKDRKEYEFSASIYTREHCLSIIDMLIETQLQMKSAPSLQIALEAVLLRILRLQQSIPVEQLIERLEKLEQRIAKTLQSHHEPTQSSHQIQAPPPNSIPHAEMPPQPVKEPSAPPPPSPKSHQMQAASPNSIPHAEMPPQPVKEPEALPQPSPKSLPKENQVRYDTLMRFAAVELEGTLRK